MTDWITGKIKKIKYWPKNLFSIIIHANINMFLPGQFTKLSLKINNMQVQRAYSYINAPENKNHEFYIKNIICGKLTSYLKSLKYDDNIMIAKQAFGTFTIKNINPCQNLWMISTGTGIGPYLSILQDGQCFKKFKKIILVYSIPNMEYFSYYHLVRSLYKKYHKQLIVQIILTQQHHVNNENFLYGRIPQLISNKILEHKINIKIHKDSTHIMLCGNPNMIKETKSILQHDYNLKKNYIDLQGHITTEQYW
ncbi:FAD-binding oxidoreductase [Enterobacteriaceae endosymbiont of Macroplea appendiculata]|uniref:FAD-binding oxidoreductase n=1 Tax=Enterobacteriaceae endosymbiont of Macroplea appendiculata TaxID=2675790 RepID=UPI001448EB93|nr:FAD-binding oxidoreductase [Enterobacteriaceae endosymbiont of Macroplea appendiculata]QJC30808.1 ferredoxin--NADP(+) reductase [Enterobacteriaceae endosymbiont of Macroplea appendiculata]